MILRPEKPKHKKEQTIGVLLILGLVVICSVISAINVIDAVHDKCVHGQIITIDGTDYTCQPTKGVEDVE